MKTTKKKIIKKKTPEKELKIKKGEEYRFEILNYGKEIIDSGIATVLDYESDIEKYWTVDKKGSKRFLSERELKREVTQK
jgi:hypothetical protein